MTGELGKNHLKMNAASKPYRIYSVMYCAVSLNNKEEEQTALQHFFNPIPSTL